MEEEVIPDIPIVITDDAILDANDECTGNNSRPQNRAGYRHTSESDKPETSESGKQEERQGSARQSRKQL